MATVKIGFVGVGRMGQCAHLKNYVTIPGCEVVAIAELREELGRRVAARYGFPHCGRLRERGSLCIHTKGQPQRRPAGHTKAQCREGNAGMFGNGISAAIPENWDSAACNNPESQEETV